MNKKNINKKTTIPVFSSTSISSFINRDHSQLNIKKWMEDEKNNSKFNFFLFTNKFINLLMRDGKKVSAAKLFFNMLVFLKKRIDSFSKQKQQKDKETKLIVLNKKDYFNKQMRHDLSVIDYLSQAVDNVTPRVEVRKVRVSGTLYLVPAILSKTRQQTLALNWIIESARKKQTSSHLNFSECLADSLYDAYKKQGHARQKRDELHRTAEANRAYIRYRWW